MYKNAIVRYPENYPDRPRSEQLVDLHVFVLPADLWNDKVNCAYNQVIDNSISAGFVRVLPETTIYYVREEIEKQLGYEIIPRDYFFLKSVGRCLAQVRAKQEQQLKVKHFCPPLNMLPELFILTSEVRSRAQTFLTTSDASWSEDGLDHDHKSKHADEGGVSPDNVLTTVRNGDPQNGDPMYSALSVSPTDSELQMSVPGKKVHAVQKRGATPSTDDSGVLLSDNGTQTESSMKDESVSADYGYNVETGQYDILTDEEIARNETVKGLRRPEAYAAAEQGIRVAKKRKGGGGIPRRITNKSKNPKENEAKMSTVDESAVNGGDNAEVADDVVLNEARRIEHMENGIDVDEVGSGLPENRSSENDLSLPLTLSDESLTTSRSSGSQKRLSTVRETDASEASFNGSEVSQDDRMMQNHQVAADQTDQDSDEHKQAQYQFVKEECRMMERKYEDLVKKAKQLQNRTGQRRNEARDLWKRRYFEEKKKTPGLEDQCLRHRNDLDGVYKRLVSQIESKDTNKGRDKPSLKGSQKVTAVKLMQETEDLRRRLDDDKLKLTSEVKLRHQAETELKFLRSETAQTKNSVSMTKSQNMNVLGSSENMYQPRSQEAPN